MRFQQCGGGRHPSSGRALVFVRGGFAFVEPFAVFVEFCPGKFEEGEITVPFRGRQIYIAGDRTFDDTWSTTFLNDTDFMKSLGAQFVFRATEFGELAADGENDLSLHPHMHALWMKCMTHAFT